MNFLRYLVICFLFACNPSTAPWDIHGTLRLSDNGHHIVHEDNTPFLWIGDTGWAMFQQLTREEVDHYLEKRKAQGFTLIQTVLFWYPHGGDVPLGPHNAANIYGHQPFEGDEDHPDTAKPLVIEGGGPTNPNDYWDHVDYIIAAAKARGLYVALLPCWGNAFINNRMKGTRIEFTEAEARAYGHFLGERYAQEPHIIWIMGGDVDPQNFGDKDQRQVYRVMAEGIGQGVSGNKSLKWNEQGPDWNQTFMSFHAVRAPKQSDARGGSSSIWFHRDAWLDVNMMETFAWTDSIYPLVTKDYQLTNPIKPTILGEGAYEGGKYKHDCNWLSPLKVRRQAYHAFFAGAAGHTYGHWAVWPFRGTNCEKSWKEVLDSPGALQIGGVLKSFLQEYDLRQFAPNQSLFLSDPGTGELRQCAMQSNEHSQILLYFPERKLTSIDFTILPVQQSLQLTWIDPRTGDKLTPVHVSDTLMPPESWEDALAIIE